MACGWLLVVVGTLVFAGGWLLDVTALKNVIPGTVVMKASTAAALACLGASLLLLLDPAVSARRRAAGKALAIAALAIGIAFLSEYALGWDLGIDEFPFRDESGRADGIEFPGRMAPTTAGSLVLVGLAMLLLDRRSTQSWRPAELLVMPVAAVASLSLIAYLYSIPAFYGPSAAAKMAMTTALCFVVIAVAVVIARPHGRLLALAVTTQPGGVLARRLLPFLIVLPLLFGWIQVKAVDAGLLSQSVGTWWLSAATILGFVLVLWRVATRMNRADGVRVRLEIDLHHLANNDELTGLANRRRFREAIDGHAARTRRTGASSALLVIDLDGLKAVNDRRGHHAGDELLAQVGRAIRASVRSSDVAARLGGDEFGVLLADATENGSRTLAEQVLLAIRGVETQDEDGAFGCTASVGVGFSSSALPDDGGSLLRGADQAMYEAKRAGGDQVACSASTRALSSSLARHPRR